MVSSDFESCQKEMSSHRLGRFGWKGGLFKELLGHFRNNSFLFFSKTFLCKTVIARKQKKILLIQSF